MARSAPGKTDEDAVPRRGTRRNRPCPTVSSLVPVAQPPTQAHRDVALERTICAADDPEVIREAGVNDVRRTAEQRRLHPDRRLLDTATRTTGILPGWNAGLDDRLQHPYCRCHADPTPRGRDAQGPELAIGLRDKHTSNHLQSIHLLIWGKHHVLTIPGNT
jgi:hypothetical protein